MKINCVKFNKVCDQEGIMQYPTIRIYYTDKATTVYSTMNLKDTSTEPDKIMEWLSSNYDIEYEKDRLKAYKGVDEDEVKFSKNYKLNLPNILDDLELAIYQLSVFSLENPRIRHNSHILADFINLVRNSFPKKTCRND